MTTKQKLTKEICSNCLCELKEPRVYQFFCSEDCKNEYKLGEYHK